MKLATLCSGIGAPEVSAKRLRWECLWSAEIDPKASAVLAHHHPESVNLGDITKINGANLEKPDVLVFGTPCQSFSVAGKRAGMDDPRGVLAFVALGIVDRVRPAWFIFENVPGLLSSNAGRDFGAFLGAVDGIGYSGAWASPDAQFFGVPQRRERVFFVGHIGDWRYPAAVLSQFSRLCGHPAPSREKGERIAPTISARTKGGGGLGTDFDCDGGLISPPITSNPYGDHESAEVGEDIGTTLNCNHEAPIVFDPNQVTSPGNYSNPKEGDPCHPLVSAAPPLMAFGWNKSASQTMRVDEIAEGLQASPTSNPAVAFKSGQGAKARGLGIGEEISPTLGSAPSGTQQSPAVQRGMSVRRLLPVECERLMGLPDSYTLIPYKGKPMADGPRYKMLGNSMAVSVMEWLLRRIEEVERIVR